MEQASQGLVNSTYATAQNTILVLEEQVLLFFFLTFSSLGLMWS